MSAVDDAAAASQMLADGDAWLEAAMPDVTAPDGGEPDVGAALIACAYYLRALVVKPDASARAQQMVERIAAAAKAAQEHEQSIRAAAGGEPAIAHSIPPRYAGDRGTVANKPAPGHRPPKRKPRPKPTNPTRKDPTP